MARLAETPADAADAMWLTWRCGQLPCLTVSPNRRRNDFVARKSLYVKAIHPRVPIASAAPGAGAQGEHIVGYRAQLIDQVSLRFAVEGVEDANHPDELYNLSPTFAQLHEHLQRRFRELAGVHGSEREALVLKLFNAPPTSGRSRRRGLDGPCSSRGPPQWRKGIRRCSPPSSMWAIGCLGEVIGVGIR